ncbi:hypothetical protein BpHYR1_036766 [Brachionus plicatilis]|uniref:Uncharacterized protein n=1 Tax=Brachionus plicatilis TaxID=10195 RepID=A0A3M7SZE3_BRAPC|nr:hypothetical protein BpHYR1_036766 [Brachionus plicatilis]
MASHIYRIKKIEKLWLTLFKDQEDSELPKILDGRQAGSKLVPFFFVFNWSKFKSLNNKIKTNDATKASGIDRFKIGMQNCFNN